MGLFSFLKRKKKNDVLSTEINSTADNNLVTNEAAPTEIVNEVENENIMDTESVTIPNEIANNEEILYSGMQLEEDDENSDNGNTPEIESENNFTNDTAIAENDLSHNYTGRFEINRTKDGKKFFFNLYASNKVGIATSQMYSTAQNALNGVKSVITNAPKAPIEDQSLKSYETLPYPKWEIYIDNGGKFRFRLNASNGSCVCHSQGYTTKTACKNGINSIIRSSRNAEIDKNYLSKN